ncbi:hypothetical protein QFW96_00420 [Saccharopolyspora sp. TS4A08]|uniref:DUF6917 domain-containing protein n=1 Tax=Saccharopolyspora ipomoeae TaxID=3042027 RepID=A0ABT6PGB9_9PSEU|nr:hypothetical protein [Saccharopolyspora sp. TS4A08]MDI2027046.1 hypothetical protein [Saccharopolyspora sp. TS4A08]
MNPDEDGPKRTLQARVVKVLVHHRAERGMSLEPHASRCVRAGDVHELVTTDHTDTAEGARIDRVAFLGFAEFDRGGVLDRGDEVWFGDRRVGTVLGFDACHFPNHYNVLIHAETPLSGADLHLRPEARLSFSQPLEVADVLPGELAPGV